MDHDLHHRRVAFLIGEGTLTFREVCDWAIELAGPGAVLPQPPAGMPEDEPLMVSVLPGPPDRRGLTGATVIPGIVR